MKQLKNKWNWFKQDIWRWIYKKIYGFQMEGYNGTLLPVTGSGKYVSVYVKGKLTQMVDEDTGEEIILIPYQPNHGVMVEYWKDGKMRWRNHLDLNQFKKNVIYASNVEQLSGVYSNAENFGS